MSRIIEVMEQKLQKVVLKKKYFTKHCSGRQVCLPNTLWKCIC